VGHAAAQFRQIYANISYYIILLMIIYTTGMQTPSNKIVDTNILSNKLKNKKAKHGKPFTWTP
jgi:uncharacterized protein YdaU (DUF1376 family)